MRKSSKRNTRRPTTSNTKTKGPPTFLGSSGKVGTVPKGKAKGGLPGHIELFRLGESLDGQLFVELGFDVKGETKTEMLPLAGMTTASKVFDVLTVGGARLISWPARRELIDRLQEHQPTGPMLRVATRVGWHGDNFVLPQRTYGPDAKTLRVYLGETRIDRINRFRVAGSFEKWLEIARLAVGNSRLQLVLSVAHNGSVATLLGVEQVNIMLVAPPATGKSTANIVAGCVWGCHRDPVMARNGFCQTFNATVNDVEDELMAVNDTLLSVDETRAADLTDEQIGPNADQTNHASRFWDGKGSSECP
jgi:hypothetical protein